jgi:hypothetical protein
MRHSSKLLRMCLRKMRSPVYPQRFSKTCFTFPYYMQKTQPRFSGYFFQTRTVLSSLIVICSLCLAPNAKADERLNGMVGLFYSTYNLVGFEYDLIFQFQKSKEWMGNISGFYISDEIFPKANRLGLGFVLGQRVDEKGTFAACITGFGENRFSRFSKIDWGAEAKVTLAIFGMKVGILNKETLFVEAGLSY